MKRRKDFDLICCDQSMRRPGFALLHYQAKGKKVSVVRMSVVDNKGDTKKGHGQMLSEIAHEQHSYIKESPNAVLVREKAIYKIMKTTAVLHKVVGVSDLYAWAADKKEFWEVSVQTVKKTITDDPNAEKSAVAAGQEKYVGKQEYKYDDMSDAVAVGVAWLIQNKYVLKKNNKDG